MNKQFVAVVVGLCMMVAIGLLWLRIEQLENKVASLTQQLNARPKVVTAVAPSQPQLHRAEGESVFKLLKTATPNSLHDGETDVGVPWSIEHGMLLDGVERNARPENSRPQIDERPIDGPPTTPLLDLPKEAAK